MNVYVIILVAGILTLGVFILSEIKKRKVFDDFIKLNVSCQFPEISVSSRSARFGMVVLDLLSVEGDFKTLHIDSVRVNTPKLKVRSHGRISAKVPVEPHTAFSVGVRGDREVLRKDLKRVRVFIEGELITASNKRVKFKKALPLTQEVIEMPKPNIFELAPYALRKSVV